MPNPAVKVEIAVEDRVTRTLERINKRIEAMRAPAQRTQKALGRFAELSGLNKVGSGLGRVAAEARGAFFSIGRLLPVMGVLTSAVSIAGVMRLATAWATFGSRLGFSAQRIGVSAGQLQALDGAARLAGASSGSLQSGMQALGQGMWDAVGGRAPEMVSAFRALHVEFQNADGSAKSVTEVMPQVADRIAAIRNPYAQAAVAARLFGSASEDLLPFLRLGSAGMARYTETARRYGVMNDEGVAAAGRLRFAQAELTLAVEGFGNSVAEAVEPVLTPVAHQMAEWIAANRGWIATKIHDYVKRFADYLKSIDWKAVEASAERIWNTLKTGVDRFGGIKTAAEGFLGLWTVARLAPLAAAVASTGPIGALLLAITAIALATERTRDAWADYQNRERMRNDDPASPETARRLAQMGHPFEPAPGQVNLHRTDHWLPSGWTQGATGPSDPAAQRLFGAIEQNDNLPSNLLDSVWAQESSRGRNMLSTAGARGHFGFMPGTGAEYGVRDPNDLRQSAEGAGHYLADLRRRYGGDMNAALAAYNWGPGNVDKSMQRWGSDWLQHAPAETRNYVGQVTARASGDDPRAQLASQANARIRNDFHRLGAMVGLSSAPDAVMAGPISAPPVTVPSGTAQGVADSAQQRQQEASLHITVRSQPGTSTTVAPGRSTGMRIASVKTQRTMDPAVTPGGI